jgi:hypothetical protein
MSNFQYLNWLSGIAKQASDISARQQKYSKSTGKKFKLSSKDISTLTGLKKQVEKTNPISNVRTIEELKKQALKTSSSFKEFQDKKTSSENNINRLSVLRDLTSGVYQANPYRPIIRYERTGTRGRRKPVYGGWLNQINRFNDNLGEGVSALERLFSERSISQQVLQDTNANWYQNKAWTEYKYIEKDKALKLINDVRSRKNYRINYTKEQLDYLNKVLTNPVLEKHLYTGGNTKYLKIGMLHNAVGLLLDPNASSDIKNSGVWVGKGGSKTDFLGGVYQVNPWSVYTSQYKNKFFADDANYQKTGLIAQKEQILLDSFLKKGGTLSGIDLNEYNKWVAESTKQQKLIDSSLNEYLKTGGASANNRTYQGSIPNNPNYLNTAYGGVSGFYGKLMGVKGPSNTYSGYVSRAKSHALLYGKAQEAAYLALQKAITAQEQKTKDITAARTQTISNISKLTEQNKAKTAIGKTVEQAKTEALKKRLSTSGGAGSYKASPKQTTQRPL